MGAIQTFFSIAH